MAITFREAIRRQSLVRPSIKKFLSGGGTRGSSPNLSVPQKLLGNARRNLQGIAGSRFGRATVAIFHPRNILRSAVYANPFTFAQGGYSSASRATGFIKNRVKSLFSVPSTVKGFAKKTFLTGLATTAPFVAYDFVRSKSPSEFFNRLKGKAQFIGGLFINPVGAISGEAVGGFTKLVDKAKDIPVPSVHFPDFNFPDFDIQTPGIPPLPQIPSLPSISIGGGGGAGGMELLLLSLGILAGGGAGYAIARKKRKRKYKKRRRHKRR